MSNLKYAATITEPRPATRPVPKETMPENPNDPFGVGPAIIEEIEEIGRKYTEPRK
jgi:hypothetical protein